ncbi:MAG: putative rane-bound dehydrogenase [Verrucomicrobiales bacterium]|nr:putative rane-bound dehydrogenase [Verrucomicrobiales bacterium]
MMKLTFLALVLSASQILMAAPDPISPVDKDGKTLNLDFETGTLKDWHAEGNAFEQQPVKGDAILKRNGPGGKSGHQGNYWIGGYEMVGDDAMGTLVSEHFKVTQPWASFLIAGGNWPSTCVELVDAESQKAFFKVSGEDSENLRPVVVDLNAKLGKEIFIRIVDQQKGGWGHINFDDFKLYAKRPKFPNELDAKKQTSVPEADAVLYEGLSPEDAVTKMTLPPGFKATLFAGEPDVKQPIAFAIDHRGRLWVAEAYTYPIRAKEGEGKDRILVFEDTNGDGKFDKRTVFIEGLNLVSGMELGFGGVFVGAAPYLMFIPIQDGDEPKPAGKTEILLDGFAYQDTHETLNTFKWGPDGWLYGCHGVFTQSNVGKPGAPDSERVRINAGVFRYHPTKKIFEVFAEGTSNPWGIDFDEHGQLISEACVIPHLFHLVQGGRFTRQAGSHFNPFVFDDIKTIGDHVHYAGNKGPHAGNGRSDSAGGGHAHAGLMVYQGDNWPAEYRGNIFIGNIHGQRINRDIPERKGSGFVGHHAPDPINFNDKWSQVINFQTGPDGAVYFIDWYDKNQCHHNDPNGHDRSNGRIYKVSYGETKFEKVDLQKKTDAELVSSLFDAGNWHFDHARRILQERGQTTNLEKTFTDFQIKTVGWPNDLRALWAGYGAGAFTQKKISELLSSKADEYCRSWTIQLLCENRGLDFVQGLGRSDSHSMDLSPSGKNILKEFARLAREDKSPVVRLYLASALQRLPIEYRWETLQGLLAHSEDADDHNLPLMVWYAAEPLATVDFNRALAMSENAKLPNILNFTVRRTAALDTTEAFAAITKSLLRVSDDKRRLDILNGLSAAFQGRRSAPMPQGWNEVETKLGASSNAEIRAQVQSLSLTFGSANALASLRKTLTDSSADANARRTALDSLLAVKAANLATELQQLLGDANLRGAALRGLALYDDAQTPVKVLAAYNSFNPAEKRDALSTLSGRVAFAKPLLEAVATEKVSSKDLSADLVRQLRTLKDEDLNKAIAKVWGAMRETSADKKPVIEKYKKVYYAGGSQPGDASRGRLVFSKTCQQCHTLFDTGGKVGPDLTGSNRADLGYILENIVDPNAVIPNDYRASTIEMKDDRIITGIVKKQDENTVTVVTPNETMVLPRKEISSMQQSQLSMMPEGLMDQLNEQDVRDLLYYLSRPGQVPMAQAAAK